MTENADHDADHWWDAVTNESLRRLAAADPKMLSPVGRDLREYARGRMVQAQRPTGEGWIDRDGDVWTLGDDGLLHSPETRPFPRAHVEKKWGPLRTVTVITSTNPRA